MKIILLSPAHPLRGGIATSAERLAYALQEAGHTVVIYSFSLQYPAFLFPGKTQYTDEPAPVGLQIKTRVNAINPLNWVRTAREMARENPDRVIVRFWLPLMGPCLGSILRLMRRVVKKDHPLKVTALVDNIIPHEKRPGDRPFAQYFVDACDDFVVMSRSVGAEIQTFIPGPPEQSKTRIRFAPHPIYDNYGTALDKAEARRQLGIDPRVPLVLFFGFIRAYKGLDLLLEALPQMPGVKALIAGECYEPWEPYQQRIDQLGLGDRVSLHLDFIPTDQVRVFFSAADLVVQPYKSATQSGISQIAYHFGKPMVVTKVGGLPEIVTDHVSGYVVEPTPEAIAAAGRDFFEQGRAETMRLGVQQEKLRFSWANLVGRLMNDE